MILPTSLSTYNLNFFLAYYIVNRTSRLSKQWYTDTEIPNTPTPTRCSDSSNDE